MRGVGACGIAILLFPFWLQLLFFNGLYNILPSCSQSSFDTHVQVKFTSTNEGRISNNLPDHSIFQGLERTKGAQVIS